MVHKGCRLGFQQQMLKMKNLMQLIDPKRLPLVAVAAREVEESNIEVTLWKKMYHIESCWGYIKGEDNKEREGTGLKKGRIIVCFFRLWYIRCPYLKNKQTNISY